MFTRVTNCADWTKPKTEQSWRALQTHANLRLNWLFISAKIRLTNWKQKLWEGCFVLCLNSVTLSYSCFWNHNWPWRSSICHLKKGLPAGKRFKANFLSQGVFSVPSEKKAKTWNGAAFMKWSFSSRQRNEQTNTPVPPIDERWIFAFISNLIWMYISYPTESESHVKRTGREFKDGYIKRKNPNYKSF